MRVFYIPKLLRNKSYTHVILRWAFTSKPKLGANLRKCLYEWVVVKDVRRARTHSSGARGGVCKVPDSIVLLTYTHFAPKKGRHQDISIDYCFYVLFACIMCFALNKGECIKFYYQNILYSVYMYSITSLIYLFSRAWNIAYKRAKASGWKFCAWLIFLFAPKMRAPSYCIVR